MLTLKDLTEDAKNNRDRVLNKKEKKPEIRFSNCPMPSHKPIEEPTMKEIMNAKGLDTIEKYYKVEE